MDILTRAFQRALHGPSAAIEGDGSVGTAFSAAVLALETRRGDIRRALGWLLNLDDDELAQAAARAGWPVERTGIAETRKSLTRLWSEVFADWRVEDLDELDLRVE